MTVHELLIQPFVDFGFMRRALVGALALALGSAPMGTLLVLRRMSLMGDATGHALLPGAALGFLIAGPSLAAMSIGSFLAAIGVALGAGVVARATAQREDASFAAFYLIALALGVMLVSLRGTSVDLMHLLFGTILAVDDGALLLICGTTCVTLAVLALLWRPLIAECVDPGFLRSVGGPGRWVHLAFLVLTVANLVAGFQAMGTLMAVGLMMLPATAARFWVGQVGGLIAVAALIAAFSGFAGLLLSYHAQWPSGPAIVLVAGAIYLLSLFVGSREGLLWQRLRRTHRLA
ncbi:metal ABC transporter permease [uncultured Pseudacidovorax sp.]|uniref:metal ABC transporter permease n=1 Tax=uncultured Pseudacidovorax sp. TaxID=679313 RepID=UPI0025CBD351|nr:metal ABC transporter permease [uncultured Pseudacidovorax sp.]